MLDYGSYDGEGDSDELVYDSEEEAEAEAAFRKEMREIKANGKIVGEVQEFNPDYDVDKQTKLIQKYKAADGVSFVEYDEFGLQKKDGLGQYITTDNSVADFTIDAPKEMVEKAYARPVGVFRDYDKEKKDMDADGKLLMRGRLTLLLQRRKYLTVLWTLIKTSSSGKNWTMIS